MSVTISVLGSINSDIVARASRLPHVGETVDGLGTDMYLGGKGTNQAVQAQLLGARTYFIGCVGADAQGESVRENLKGQGVDDTFLYTLPNRRTGCCVIYVDTTNGDNMLVYDAGANKAITREIVDSAKERIKDSSVFITQNEINADMVAYGLSAAKSLGVTTILNPAPAVPLPEDVFTLADYITPNETESEAYTGILRADLPLTQWARANAEWFLKKGVKNVCITLGDKGAYYYDGAREVMKKAFRIRAADTTAAGDAFNGGLAYGAANGWDIEKSMLLGSACGAMAAMTVGAQNSLRPMDDILHYLKTEGHTLA
ncbi:MAG TPA: ribokinase [Feifaniaceae bacterium]|nr:ribokinase [Feifaniaceae bacterium]